MDCMQFACAQCSACSSYSCFNTASGMDCMQFHNLRRCDGNVLVSIPQAVWIACNERRTDHNENFQRCFNTASGMDCMQFKRDALGDLYVYCFNTASGMDCMQYCLPKPLETVNPKGGFLILPPYLRFSPNRREFFCRKRRLRRGAKPAIPRKLLSTKKT